MAGMNFVLKRNDKDYKVTYTITEQNGSTVNLTGASVQFHVGNNTSIIINNPATIESALTGIVSYTFSDQDTLFDGLYTAEFVVTFADGSILSYPRSNYLTVNIQKNVDLNQTNISIGSIAQKQGDYDAKLTSILAQAGNLGLSSMEEAQWTATNGQLTYVMPTTVNYSADSKWLSVFVGNSFIEPSLVDQSLSGQITLLIPSSQVTNGTIVTARWSEPMIPNVDLSEFVKQNMQTPIVETYTATIGQTIFPLVSSYTVGSGLTRVTIDGVPQSLTTDYTESGTKQITLVEGATLGAIIKIFIYTTDSALTNYVNTINPHLASIDTQLTDIATDVKIKFGAKGDGVTDDTAAIQNALTNLPANSVLFFPVGTYIVSSQLTWDGTVNLIGANRDSTIIKANASFTTLLYKKDEAMLCGRITELTFDGNGLVDYVLDFTRGKGFRGYHNFFKNAKNSVVRFGSSATWGAYEVHFYDNNIIGLDNAVGASANRPMYALELASNSSDSEFYENILTNCSEAGILQNGKHDYVRDNHIYGYPLDYIPRYGIKTTGITNRNYHNRLDTASVSGIYCNAMGNFIESNHIFWSGDVTDYTGKCGITLDNSGNNLKYMNCINNFTEGWQLTQDIKLIGNMPDRSKIRDNITDMNSVDGRFNNQWTGTVAVPNGATTVPITYLFPFANYNFQIKWSTNFNSVVSVTPTLTGATFNIVTPVNWTGAEIYYEIIAIL